VIIRAFLPLATFAALLTGCTDAAPDNRNLAIAEAAQRAAAQDGGNVVCARKGSNDFARICLLERATSDAGLVLTARHPDGAFHRLLVTTDGRGVIAADGAEKATVTVIDANQIEIELGGDRYRLPATVRSPAKPPS